MIIVFTSYLGRQGTERKFFSLLLCIIMLLGAPKVFGVTYGAVSDLQALGIIDGGSVEDTRLNDCITRAEFAKIVVELDGTDGMGLSYDLSFSDVSREHWASEYIGICKARGLIDGMEDGRFYPEKNILLQDAYKVIVNLLGYGERAKARGGYPSGYIAQAAAIGLSEKTNGKNADDAIRADIFQLAANALDIGMPSEESVGVSGISYTVDKDNTLRTKLLEKKDLFEGEGLITACYSSYLTNPVKSIKTDEIEIDGKRYRIGNTAAKGYFGMQVVFTAYEDRVSGERTLTAIAPHKKVQTIKVTDKSFIGCQNYTLSYIGDSDKIKEIKINPAAAVIYNNRPLSYPAEITVENGSVNLYDNDNDELYDVALIFDYISVPVENVNESGESIRLKAGMSFDGRGIISLDMENKDFQTCLFRSNGESVALSEVTGGGVVSVLKSRDGSYLGLIFSDSTLNGVITEIGEDYIGIDGGSYQTEGAGFNLDEDISVGSDVAVYLNFDGRIAYVEAHKDENSGYGYIIAKKQGVIGARVQLQMVTEGSVSMIEEDPDNDPSTDNNEKVLVAQNGALKIFDASDGIKIDGVRTKDADAIPTQRVMKYKLGSDGTVTELITPKLADNDRKKYYDATDNVFGKTLGEPFGIGEKSVVICVPSNSVSSDEDYLATVKMNDGQQYTVSGYDIDDADCNVGLLVIAENMEYDDKGVIGVGTKIAVVKSVKTVADGSGGERMKIVLLTEGMEKQLLAAEYADSGKFKSLGTGDLIYYSKNARGELIDFKRITQLSAEEGYYVTGSNTDDERAFGMLDNISENRISALKNKRVNRLTVQIDELNAASVKSYDAQITYKPAMFIYDMKRDAVEPATIEDARAGENIFIHSVNGVVMGIIFIRR